MIEENCMSQNYSAGVRLPKSNVTLKAEFMRCVLITGGWINAQTLEVSGSHIICERSTTCWIIYLLP
ncbi:hypothetical protein SODG_001153 [Sodalis praecaptivus]|nr:hypothetical protein NVIRENTERO_00138 [Sodalis praecaptivus]